MARPGHRSEAESAEAAFEALFDAVFSRAVASAERITSNRAVAEELAAEALVRAYERWNRLQTHPTPDLWVLRTAINLALDAVRRRPPPIEAAGVVGGGEEPVMARMALGPALRKLPARQRQVVGLRYLADLSEQEVAAALGISTGAVKTHLHRGMEQLRSTLGPDAGALEPAPEPAPAPPPVPPPPPGPPPRRESGERAPQEPRPPTELPDDTVEVRFADG